MLKVRKKQTPIFSMCLYSRVQFVDCAIFTFLFSLSEAVLISTVFIYLLRVLYRSLICPARIRTTTVANGSPQFSWCCGTISLYLFSERFPDSFLRV